MKANDIIKAALKKRGKTQKWLAESMGAAPDSLSKKLAGDTLLAAELIRALGLLGMEVAAADTDTGERLDARGRVAGVLPRTTMMVGGVIYDTAKADALCHTGEANCVTLELYRDYRGLFFLAIASMWGCGDVVLSPCEESYAAQLYATYREDGSEPPEAVFPSSGKGGSE